MKFQHQVGTSVLCASKEGQPTPCSIIPVNLPDTQN